MLVIKDWFCIYHITRSESTENSTLHKFRQQQSNLVLLAKLLSRSGGSATEHVLYFKCHRNYYNGSASVNVFYTACAYSGISIIILLRPFFRVYFFLRHLI